jgi:hypothetical protein
MVGATGSDQVANASTAGLIFNALTNALSITGNVTGSNLNTTGGNISTTGTVVSGNIINTGEFSAQGNVALNTVTGGISAILLSTGTITLGGTSQTGAITIGRSSANITLTLGTGATGTGNTKTVNIGVNGSTGSNTVITVGPSTGNGNVSFTANTTIAVANTSGSAFSVAGNITGGNLTVGTGNVNLGNIVNNNAGNGVGNIGSSTNYFDTVFAKATSAQYADLAEKYRADRDYIPGTVVSFGGEREVTESLIDSDRKVAGVISKNPSYVMNAGLSAEYLATVALMGRVHVKVLGPVRKGDMMVSAGNGCARSDPDPKTGALLGKSLEDHPGPNGIIEIVVGRV